MLARMRVGGIAAVVVALALVACASAGAAGVPAIRLSATHAVEVGARAEFRGRVVPPRPYATVRLFKGSSLVAKAPVKRDGSFYVSAPLAAPGPYQVRFRGVLSNPVRVLIRPVLTARFVGGRAVGKPLAAVAQVRPAGAGPIRIRVLRNGKETFNRLFRAGSARVALGTVEPGTLRVQVTTEPPEGYAGRSAAVEAKLE